MLHIDFVKLCCSLPSIKKCLSISALALKLCTVCTFLWAAACVWTAWAANIAAAVLRAALTAADTEKYDQKQCPEYDQQHSQPI